MALQRVREGGEFPGAEVSGEKKDAFAAGVGALEVFEAVVDDYAGDILASVAGEEADFGELAAEGNEFSAKQAAALARGISGKARARLRRPTRRRRP